MLVFYLLTQRFLIKLIIFTFLFFFYKMLNLIRDVQRALKSSLLTKSKPIICVDEIKPFSKECFLKRPAN